MNVYYYPGIFDINKLHERLISSIDGFNLIKPSVDLPGTWETLDNCGSVSSTDNGVQIFAPDSITKNQIDLTIDLYNNS